MTMNQSFVEQVRTPAALSADEMARVQSLYENILMQSDAHSSMGRIPRAYAEALVNVAGARGALEEVATNYYSLVYDIFPAVPGLEQALYGASLGKRAKDELITRVLEGRASPVFVDFLKVLNRKDRLGLLRVIGIACRELLDERAGRVRVLVETAAPLSDEQQERLRQTLAEAHGIVPVLVVRENPDLLGGMVVHVGDKVFDTSVRSKLTTLRNTILARGNNAVQRDRNRFRS